MNPIHLGANCPPLGGRHGLSGSGAPLNRTLLIDTEALVNVGATSQTAETFASRLSSVALVESENKKEFQVMSFDDLDQHKMKSGGSGTKMMCGAISVIGFLIILASLDFFLFNIFLDVSGEMDFCVEGDKNVRMFLAREFNNAMNVNVDKEYLIYNFYDIKCLPSFSFSALNSTQKEQLSRVRNLYFENAGLQEISEFAFADQAIRNLRTLSLRRNSISNLADELLSPLIDLRALDIVHNNFTKLDSDVFRNSKSLSYIQMNFNPLVEIPTALVGWKIGAYFYADYCPFLAGFQDQTFSDSSKLRIVNLRGTKLALEYEDPRVLERALGIKSANKVVYLK